MTVADIGIAEIKKISIIAPRAKPRGCSTSHSLRLMNVSPQDLLVFVAFFVVVLGLSYWKSRKQGNSDGGSSDFFLAGRGLTWPLIGISIVAANISTEQMVGMAGQAAGSVGLAVSSWQLLGSVFIVIISMTLLPKFLRAGIYTMPEYLEYR